MFNKVYATPVLVKFGKSKELIQGECGIGLENFSLDKTGFYWFLQKNCLETKNCNYESVCQIKDPPDTCYNHANC